MTGAARTIGGCRPPPSGLHLLAKQLPVIGRVVVKDVIAIVDDRLAESRFGHGGFVKLDPRPPCAEIDARFTDTAGLQQGSFVAHGAGGAMHTADCEGDCGHAGSPSCRAVSLGLLKRR
jgi:hypothetical protein